MHNSTKRFSSRVENYTRYRPGYPLEIIGLLRDECGLIPDSIIADIGSGTGKLIPNCSWKMATGFLAWSRIREMRQADRRTAASKISPVSPTVDGTAEATTLRRTAARISSSPGRHFTGLTGSVAGRNFSAS